jgi:hypothetical protein
MDAGPVSSEQCGTARCVGWAVLMATSPPSRMAVHQRRTSDGSVEKTRWCHERSLPVDGSRPTHRANTDRLGGSASCLSWLQTRKTRTGVDILGPSTSLETGGCQARTIRSPRLNHEQAAGLVSTAWLATPRLGISTTERTLDGDDAHVAPRLRAGMRVLDLGCGGCSLTLAIGAAVAPGEVLGVDLQAGVVERRRRQPRTPDCVTRT